MIEGNNDWNAESLVQIDERGQLTPADEHQWEENKDKWLSIPFFSRAPREWKFASAHRLAWTPGNIGRYIVEFPQSPDAVVHTWNIDSKSGDPDHWDYVTQHGLDAGRGIAYGYIGVTGKPRGEASNLVAKHLNSETETEWHFANMGPAQIVRTKLDAVNHRDKLLYPDWSNHNESAVIYDPDAHTVYLGRPMVHHDDLMTEFNLTNHKNAIGDIDHATGTFDNHIRFENHPEVAQQIADLYKVKTTPGFFDPNAWHFASYHGQNGGHTYEPYPFDGTKLITEPWEPGKDGKGMFFGGKPHMWKVDRHSGPHHGDIAGEMMGPVRHNDIEGYFHIGPDGTVQAEGSGDAEAFAAHDPRLKPLGRNDEWRFGSWDYAEMYKEDPIRHIVKSEGPPQIPDEEHWQAVGLKDGTWHCWRYEDPNKGYMAHAIYMHKYGIHPDQVEARMVTGPSTATSPVTTRRFTTRSSRRSRANGISRGLRPTHLSRPRSCISMRTS
jgi:hypothetical protein